jgi:rhamnose utilization protein RhaD (predicted bifunctional aldolase and dehydrogenase)
VEAPLHNVFEAKFVVHTHPFAVNGLTCAKGGEPACRKLFPEALWVEYVDPGYTLCMEVRKRIETYKTAHGRDPSLLMLKNHGIFIAADRAEEIRELTAHVMDTLRALYTKAALSLKLEEAPGPEEAGTEAGIRALFGRDGMFTAPSGRFAVASGPITPDHLVYANAFPFTDPLTAESAARYKKEHGYAPKVVVAGRGVYGIGTSQVHANLALDLAKDGAQVVRLTEAFGGIEYMTDSARKFIENWEVESYRKKQVSPFPSPP